ncbi:MAG TPA: expansin EXLX1 family cellulose-binding protein [Mycobacteriales bacterium]|nr:expansin EXLX1 family cellulose-binding protein [Mycobacteriales bacterium]
MREPTRPPRSRDGLPSGGASVPGLSAAGPGDGLSAGGASVPRDDGPSGGSAPGGGAGARHRSGRGGRRPVGLLAGGLTAVVALGAAALVATVRDGGTAAPAPESLNRPPAASLPAPAPTRGPARTDPAPAAAGTMRAAPRTTAAPSTASRAAHPPASSAPAPTTRAAAGASRSGRATFYTLAGLPNCGYEDAAAAGTYVAMSPVDFGGSAACGTVLDVTGPKGTVRVTVSDLCPECESGHLDLAAPAFARIADPVSGIVPITFTRVVDPPTAGPVRIRVKEGSSQYWLALLPIGTGNPLASVAVRIGAGWQPLQRSGYGYWIAPAGAGPGPYSVRLTDDRGHSATGTVPLTVGATVSTGIRLY